MIRAYGEWPSPISAALAAASSRSLTWVSGRGDETWWCASDPGTGTVRLMCRRGDGDVVDVLGSGRSARNRVCGYGGRPYVLFGDVADCVSVARALAREVDPARVAIRGDSAGGWTTLAALVHTDVFCAGAVYYPIADATRWSVEHTHDFESRYLDGLVRPQDREQISPLHHVDQITSPLVMLQGAEDTICPPEHATSIVAAVRARGLWHRLLMFPGEGHGFRRASSVRDSLLAEAELYSYAMHIDIAVPPPSG